MQVNYLEMNNRDSILADLRIRKALAYAMDYDGISTYYHARSCRRTVGPIHPDKSYYNNDLKPIHPGYQQIPCADQGSRLDRYKWQWNP